MDFIFWVGGTTDPCGNAAMATMMNGPAHSPVCQSASLMCCCCWSYRDSGQNTFATFFLIDPFSPISFAPASLPTLLRLGRCCNLYTKL